MNQGQMQNLQNIENSVLNSIEVIMKMDISSVSFKLQRAPENENNTYSFVNLIG